MRMFARLVVVNALLWLTAEVGAQQPPAASTAKLSAAPATFRPVATIQEIMATMIDPASKIVFDAVGTTTSAGVVQQKAPTTDEDWAVVRNNALLMIEGSNLIMMQGRHVASAALSNKAGAGEITPAAIEALLSKNRLAWNKLAREFGAAAGAALKAADARSPESVMESGDGIDTACENCHMKFWYPDQDKLFEKK
jgi:hypothetical protein